MSGENGGVEFILAWPNSRNTAWWQSDRTEREIKIERYDRALKIDVGQDFDVASWCSTIVDNGGTKLKSSITRDTLSVSIQRSLANVQATQA